MFFSLSSNAHRRPLEWICVFLMLAMLRPEVPRVLQMLCFQTRAVLAGLRFPSDFLTKTLDGL